MAFTVFSLNRKTSLGSAGATKGQKSCSQAYHFERLSVRIVSSNAA